MAAPSRLMRRALPAAVLLLLLVSQTGCVLYSHEIAQTQQALEDEYPDARFDKETMLNLGPVSLWMAGGVLRVADGETYAQLSPYLRHLDRVKLGVYEARFTGPPDQLDPTALPFLRDERWRTVVHTRDPNGEYVWILARPDRNDGPPRDLFLFTLDQSELVALRLRGDLDRLAQQYIEEENVLEEWLGWKRSEDAEDAPSPKATATSTDPTPVAPAPEDSTRATSGW